MAAPQPYAYAYPSAAAAASGGTPSTSAHTLPHTHTYGTHTGWPAGGYGYPGAVATSHSMPTGASAATGAAGAAAGGTQSMASAAAAAAAVVAAQMHTHAHTHTPGYAGYAGYYYPGYGAPAAAPGATYAGYPYMYGASATPSSGASSAAGTPSLYAAMSAYAHPHTHPHAQMYGQAGVGQAGYGAGMAAGQAGGYGAYGGYGGYGAAMPAIGSVLPRAASSTSVKPSVPAGGVVVAAAAPVSYAQTVKLGAAEPGATAGTAVPTSSAGASSAMKTVAGLPSVPKFTKTATDSQTALTASGLRADAVDTAVTFAMKKRGGSSFTSAAAIPPQVSGPAAGVQPAPPVPHQPPLPPAPPPPSSRFAPTADAPSSSASKWPKDLEEYAARALAAVAGKDIITQTAVRNAVTARISAANQRNALWTTNWKAEPLPPLAALAASGDGAPGRRRPRSPQLGDAGAPGAPTFEKRPRRGKAFVDDESNEYMALSGGSAAQSAREKGAAASGTNVVPVGQRRRTPANEAEDGPEGSHLRTRSTLAAVAAATEASTKTKGKAPRAAGDGDARSLLQLVFGQTQQLTRLDWDRLTIKGTCTNLEKRYFRLIAAPDPSTVRPEHILHKSLDHVLARWRDGAEYKAFVNDQLKSIRQDLTLQRIRNDFTVRVYETHARIALEVKDPIEFRACLAQLSLLEQHGVRGHHMEFLAYRLMHAIYHPGATDARQVVAKMTAEELGHPYIVHALAVWAAVSIGNFHRFFALHRTAPNYGSYLMEFMFHNQRVRALQTIADAYRPSVPLEFVRSELAFESVAACRDFATRAGGVIVERAGERGTELVFDTKNSTIRAIRELSSTEEDQLAQAGIDVETAYAEQMVEDDD